VLAYGLGPIVTDGMSVYFTNFVPPSGPGTVLRCPAMGCAGNPASLATNLGNVGPLAIGGHLFWAMSDLVNNIVRLVACPLEGCAAPTVLYTQPPLSIWSLDALADDCTSIYWTTTFYDTDAGAGGLRYAVMKLTAQ
jgi:hypothetical protein